jgi:signal transduction histidine kinase
MSIRFRFTVALTLIGVVLFGTYGALAYRGERDDLHHATVREIRLIGRSLETSLGNALRDRNRADIDETLANLEATEPDIDIHLHDKAGIPIAHSKDATIDRDVEQLVARAAASRTEIHAFEPSDDSPTRLVFAAPVIDDDGTLLGAMAVVRPVTDLNAELDRTRWRMLAVVATFVAMTLMVGIVLGSVYVSRPIAALLGGVRSARGGDFRSPVPAGRRDEIGALVDEFNTMLTALGDARSQIEHEIEARVRLEQGLERADKLITIGQLTAGVAHEIGSPLQVMSGRAYELAHHKDPEIAKRGEILLRQTERITRIVEQLMSFGRRRPPRLARCDLIEPVRQVIELVAPEARRRSIKLEVDADDNDHVIDADVDQLQQVAINLIKNAMHATPDRGSITVRVEGAGDMVHLSVRDNGKGIAPEVQARLFEPFFTTRATEGGTGLGLAVVRAIAVEHGGTVQVHSELGHGAEFIASFPRKHPEAARS